MPDPEHIASFTRDHQSRTGRRKRVLMEILDALNELSHDQELDVQGPNSAGEDEWEGFNSETHYTSKNPGGFYVFRRHVKELDKEVPSQIDALYIYLKLPKLDNLGQAFRQLGSAGIISSSYQLRRQLTIVLFLFSHNAARLFPKVKLEWPPHISYIDLPQSSECFPEHLEQLGKNLRNFRRNLHEYADVVHEDLDDCVIALESNLKYWTSSLHDFKGQFLDQAVQQYMHSLCGEMEKPLHILAGSIVRFIESGVSAARLTQQQRTTTLVSLSGLATFVSAVTATGLQMTYNRTHGTLDAAVNTFWFSSLVFSVASAVNSLLGLTWTQAPYRSPHDHIPWWISMWIKQTPLVFLVIALVTFSGGLVLFTWDTAQSLITCLIVTLITGISFFSLLAVSVWCALERSIFIRNKGQCLLAEVLGDLRMHWTGKANHQLSAWTNMQKTNLSWCWSMVTKATCKMWNTLIPSTKLQYPCYGEGTLPSSNPQPPPTHGSIQLSNVSTISPTELLSTALLSGQDIPEESDHEFSNRPTSDLQKDTSLNFLEMTEIIPAHPSRLIGALSDLQFSLDGKWLATSNWDTTKLWINTKDKQLFARSHTLDHGQFDLVDQVAWSPTSGYVLTALLLGVNIWTDNGDLVNKIKRHQCVRSVAWLPSGKAFLSLERAISPPQPSEVNKIDIWGNLLDTYWLPQFLLHSMAVTPNGQYLIGVASWLGSSMSPYTTRHTRLIVYNMPKKIIESQVPVASSLESIQLSKNGEYVLVSGYKSPTQLWCLNKTDDPDTIHLWRYCSYISSSDFSATSCSYFGGNEDQFILRGGKDGQILIWDRESATLLHKLHNPGTNVSHIAWNPASNFPMLAVGSSNGKITLWVGDASQPGENKGREIEAIAKEMSASSCH